MSLIVAKHIDEEGRLDVRKLYDKYSIYLIPGSRVMCFFNRVFNEKKEIVSHPNVRTEAEFIKAEYNFMIDLSHERKKYGVPKGYFVEIIALNILFEEEGKKTLIPVFPNEMVLDCEYGIEDVIKSEIDTLKKVVPSYEVIGVLHQAGFQRIADDFRDAMIKFGKSDYTGCIGSFRNVVEAFRSFAKDQAIETENRTKLVHDFLSKAFQLMSSFGLHAGTSASMEEAILSKDIATAVSQYMTTKVESKRIA